MTVALLVSSGCGDDVDCSSFEFDSEGWMASSDDFTREAGAKRHEMAEALVACDTLVGRTRPEIRELLGRPVDRAARAEYFFVGAEPGPISVDDELLAVRFDRRRVVEAELVTG